MLRVRRSVRSRNEQTGNRVVNPAWMDGDLSRYEHINSHPDKNYEAGFLLLKEIVLHVAVLC